MGLIWGSEGNALQLISKTLSGRCSITVVSQSRRWLVGEWGAGGRCPPTVLRTLAILKLYKQGIAVGARAHFARSTTATTLALARASLRSGLLLLQPRALRRLTRAFSTRAVSRARRQLQLCFRANQPFSCWAADSL
eukprot:2221844-Rhodomonas_salina.1